mgnify:CR=1 FL=1
MTLSLKEVRHIAELARLKLSPDEEARYREQLSAILDYAARLRAVDTTAIPPTATVLPLDAPLRPDVPRRGVGRDQILSNASDTADGMFCIPPIFDP